MSEEIVVNVVESVDEIEVTLFEAELGPVGPQGEQGMQGEQGPPGNPGITVSSTAPVSPTLNQLWVQIPP